MHWLLTFGLWIRCFGNMRIFCNPVIVGEILLLRPYDMIMFVGFSYCFLHLVFVCYVVWCGDNIGLF